jgi:hypothetical protein
MYMTSASRPWQSLLNRVKITYIDASNCFPTTKTFLIHPECTEQIKLSLAAVAYWPQGS